MIYFAYGFATAIIIFMLIAYVGIKLHKKQPQDDIPHLTDSFKIEYYKGNNKYCSTLECPKYEHSIRGPMADDIYNWITGEKEGEE